MDIKRLQKLESLKMDIIHLAAEGIYLPEALAHVEKAIGMERSINR